MATGFSPELSRRIADEYPSVLAVPFADFEAELSLGGRNPLRAFGRMIDLYEIVMITLSLVSACDVLSRPGPYGANLERLFRELRENPKLSSGFWWEMLRELMSFGLESGAPGITGELAGRYYNGKGRTTDVVKKLDAIPSLRNKAKGHAWTMSEDKYLEFLDAHAPHLGEVFSFAEPLCRWAMVSPLGAVQGADGAVNDLELAVGNRLRPVVGRLVTPQPLKTDGLYLVRREALSALPAAAEAPPLELSPLLIRRRRQGAPMSETFLLQGVDKKKVHYLGTVSSERIEEDLVRDVLGLLTTAGGAASGFSLKSEKILAPLRAHCRRVSESFLKNAAAQGVFLEHAYVEPRRVRQQLDSFLESGLPAALLVGMSGLGKTSFTAHYVREWLQGEPAGLLVLALAADGLYGGRGGLAEEIGAAFDNGLPLEDNLGFLEKNLTAKENLKVLVLVEGVDKCPDPPALIAALGTLAASFQGSRTFRLAATSTPAVLENWLGRGGELPARLFFQPNFGTSGARQALPCISFPMLEKEELAQAYAAYRAAKGTCPTTEFEELSAEMAGTLCNPLILRMAMELYDGRRLPPGVMNGDLMREFAVRRIFGDRRRIDMVSALVDLILSGNRRSVTFAEMLSHPVLRAYLLEEGASSPFVQMRDEQVLLIAERRSGDGLPFPPEWGVEFTFDRVLEYLIFWRLFSGSPGNLADPGRFLEQARAFPPLRGALLFLYGHYARTGRYGQLDRLFSAGDEWTEELLSDVLSGLLEAEAGEGDAALAGFVRHGARLDGGRMARVCGNLAVRLFGVGRWADTGRLIRVTADLPGLPAEQRVLWRNRLVLLEKNMDRWDEALRLSDLCLAERGGLREEALFCRVQANRSSVLYDLGPRAAALEVLLDGEKRAVRCGAELELAAIRNNLGLYRLYNDGLEDAEAMFSLALDAARDRPVARAYVENNLGLLLMNRSLTGPDAVEGARERFTRAYEAFARNGHLQGISYSASNLGLVHLACGEAEAANARFLETQTIAGRLGEKWTAYGSLANQALSRLSGPAPDPAAAWKMAGEAVERAAAGGDQKGVADAGLIAAQAALALLEGGAAVDVEAVFRQLDGCRKVFASLGQRLGGFMAVCGLARLKDLRPDFAPPADADPGMDLRDPTRLLAGTSYAGLQPRFTALPWHMFLLMEVF